MTYTNEQINAYIAELMKNLLATEIGLEDNKELLEKVVSDMGKCNKTIDKANKDIEELKKAQKEGSKDKQVRESRKELMSALQMKVNSNIRDLQILGERKHRYQNNIDLYSDFIEAAQRNIERAKKRLESKI